MTEKFAEINKETFTGLIVPRGGTYGGRRFGKKSPDTIYIKAGLYPLVDTPPAYDKNTQEISVSYSVDKENKLCNKVYTVADIPADKLLKKKSLAVEKAVQNVLDDTAREHRYDSIISACSYATSNGTFGVEAQKFVDWRDAVWTHVIKMQKDVQNGTRKESTLEELLSELPKFE